MKDNRPRIMRFRVSDEEFNMIEELRIALDRETWSDIIRLLIRRGHQELHNPRILIGQTKLD